MKEFNNNCLALYLASQLLLLVLFAGRLRGEIIFSDDFETGNLSDHWEEIKATRQGDAELETRSEYVFEGTRSLRLTAVANGGQVALAQTAHWFMPGYDQLYYRWYAKFSADFDQGNFMHWVLIGGNSIYDKWSASGKAGLRPTGRDFFATSLETWRGWGRYPPPGAMNFYTYFPEMTASPDGYYWGNQFQPRVPFLIERNRWYCFEFMVKLNQPGVHDGEQAFWIDGVKIYNQKDIRWRDVDFLKLNLFWFSVYIHESRQDNTCWFDNLVISTDYVGPLAAAPAATRQCCDFDLDGISGRTDFMQLLLMKRDEPEDGRGDYNRDGRNTIADALQLLLDQRAGKCGSCAAALSGSRTGK